MTEIQFGGTTALDIAQFVALIVAAALAGFTAWQGFHAANAASEAANAATILADAVPRADPYLVCSHRRHLKEGAEVGADNKVSPEDVNNFTRVQNVGRGPAITVRLVEFDTGGVPQKWIEIAGLGAGNDKELTLRKTDHVPSWVPEKFPCNGSSAETLLAVWYANITRTQLGPFCYNQVDEGAYELVAPAAKASGT